MTNKTYVLTMDDKTKKEVTFPETYGVSSDSYIIGESNSVGSNQRMLLVVKFYESNRQAAAFTSVTCFMDSSVEVKDVKE